MASNLPDEVHQDLQFDCSLQNCALFLDVDGTLLPIAARPQEVHVPSSLLTLLDHLREKLDGAVALVSGRAIADLDNLFAPLALPAAGVHGLERRGVDTQHTSAATTASLDPLRRFLVDFVERSPGPLLEDKGLSLAVHYRMVPDREVDIERYLKATIAKHAPFLELARGKMVFEMKPGGINKGTAIEAFMAEQPFRGRIPVFLGDDITDEDGFAVVNRLGGLSVRIGEKGSTKATQNLPNEAAVHAWLRHLLADAKPS